ncbi:DUF3352 domain-containing protein [Crateriforma conspicua]|uniref:DUF3352 domain-containing protein n=1 Tax=Crateriforma conspicua TaxID=2527996 RepID=UPI00118C10EE|nr:DUF3352 domain-containing protein [Crateriforma conspicua]QDV64298.1 hypothetical protein Mal65_34510 [Crateriforma conspicua]
MFPRSRRCRLDRFCRLLMPLLVVSAVLPWHRSAVAADAESSLPGAPMLLPQDTLAYIRIADVQDIREGFGRTSMGRMMQDPQMKPFVSDVYGVLDESFQEISAVIGVELGELLNIPQGQVALALVPQLMPEPDPDQEVRDEDDDESEEAIKRRLAQKRRQQNGFAFVLIVDAKDNIDTINRLLEKFETQLAKDRLIRRDATIDGTKLVRWLPPRVGRPPVEYFVRDGAMAIGVGQDTAGSVLKRWVKEDTSPSFANNNDFTSVLSRSVGAEDTMPQLTFFVDPYHIVERIIKANGGAAALAWPLIEQLGISKIRGIGGSTFQGGEFFDDISHLHIVIDTPRDGFFGVLRPSTGDTVPPAWVPADATSYMTVHWDFPQTLENLGKILDKFNGEGSVDRFMEEPLQKRTGISLQNEILPLSTGRMVSVRWLEPPMRINSQINCFAFEVNDRDQATEVFDRLVKRFPNAMKPVVIAGTMTYDLNRNRNQKLPEGLRRPEPTLFQLGNWIVFCDSQAFIQRMVQTNAGVLPGLDGEPEYGLVSGELGGKLDGEQPFMISYVRGSDYFRQMFELTKNPSTRQFLRRVGEDNVLARKFVDLLERDELPEFSQFEKYFGAGGMFAYDESGGIHIGTFTLKPLE